MHHDPACGGAFTGHQYGCCASNSWYAHTDRAETFPAEPTNRCHSALCEPVRSTNLSEARTLEGPLWNLEGRFTQQEHFRFTSASSSFAVCECRNCPCKRLVHAARMLTVIGVSHHVRWKAHFAHRLQASEQGNAFGSPLKPSLTLWRA
jgi:hypothetical protein